MGTMRDFNLEDYNCDIYVETGTGNCTTLYKAISAKNINKCYSVDIDLNMVVNARQRFCEASIEHSLSTVAMERWLTTELSLDSNVLFFLDAHFPGADFHNKKYDVFAPHAVPLKEELELIKKYRPNGKDIIICDDARIYTSGLFENGDISDWLNVPGGYRFVYDLFPDAKISLHYSEEGYIIINRQ
jgi:hypothetical protein